MLEQPTALAADLSRPSSGGASCSQHDRLSRVKERIIEALLFLAALLFSGDYGGNCGDTCL